MKQIVKPPPLRKGDTIGIFTPAKPGYAAFPDKYRQGIAQIERLGFRVREGSLTARRASQGYRSGTPQERAAELMELVRDPGVRAIVATLGGSCSASLIPYLDFEEIRERRKIFCGLSDLTALHLAILARSGLSTFYGPSVLRGFASWPEIDPETRDSFLAAVGGQGAGAPLRMPARYSDEKGDWAGDWKRPRAFQANPGWKALRPGKARGQVLVANVATLVHAAQTPDFPEFAGKILVLEEMDAVFSKTERALTHLSRAGVFDRLAGLLFSKPEKIDAEGAPFGYEALLTEILGARAYPIVTGFDCGHTAPMITLAQMTEVELDAGPEETRFTVLEPMVAP